VLCVQVRDRTPEKEVALSRSCLSRPDRFRTPLYHCAAFIAHHYVKYGDLYKTLGWKKWLGVTAVATPALVNVAATSPVLNKAPLGSTLGNGTPLKYTVVYFICPVVRRLCKL
jgi:hypothetical protein